MAMQEIANLKGPKGDGYKNPRLQGDNLVFDAVRQGVESPEIAGNVRGPQGLAGVNALPGDAAVADWINTAGTSATKTAVQNAVGRATKTLTVGAPSGSHRAHLQAAIDQAAAQGFARVLVPPVNTANPSEPWSVDADLVMRSNIEFDARGVNFVFTRATYDRPLFYIGPTVEGAQVHVGHAYTPGTLPASRPAASAYPSTTVYGAPARAAYSGVMVYGQRSYITGKFSGFRNGVRLGDWSGTGTGTNPLREGNVIDIETAYVDFGLVYFGQRGMHATVNGNYYTTTGSDEPAHLVYGTWSENVSVDCTVNGEAVDSTGGAAFIFKGNSGLRSDYLRAVNCSSVVTVSSGRGNHTFGEITGTNLTGTYNRADGSPYYVEGIRSEFATEDSANIDVGRRSARTVSLNLADSYVFGELRAMSLRNGWSIDSALVDYKADEISSGVTLIHVYGTASTIGAIRISNRGTGGVRGLRYTTGSSHSLTTAPVMSGVSHGVTIDAPVAGVFTVDESLISRVRATDPALVYTSSSLVVIKGVRGTRRINRWYGLPAGYGATPARPTQGNLHAIPLRLDAVTLISSLAVNVITGQAGAVVRMGIYGDGAGQPGVRILDAGTAAATTAGAKTVSFTPQRLTPGDYWLVYAVQGADNIALTGVEGTTMDIPATSAANAISGNSVAATGIAGALPNSFGTLVSSSTVVARMSYLSPSPS